jgi:hypothetical protein
MSRIKQCFTSRWADGGLLEVDFSQLEVVGVALLSDDEVLKDDIRSGRDMHRVRAAQLFGCTEAAVSKQQRQVAKAFSFQLQYGAGAKSMAAKNGVSLEVAQKFIDQYYGRYSRLKEWQDENMEEVAGSRVATATRTHLGEPRGKGVLYSPTGRMYSFHEEDAPEFLRTRTWGKKVLVSFSPTQIKNYPSQGFATGDVMALFRAKLFRKGLSSGGHILPIMTIHDSVMFDCYSVEAIGEAMTQCEDAANDLPKQIESLWGIRCDLPFKVEGKWGHSWDTLAPFKK